MRLLRCLVGQAKSELSDEKKREDINAVVAQARILVFKEHKLPTNIDLDDERIKKLTPPFKTQVRTKSKELLIDEELRRRK